MIFNSAGFTGTRKGVTEAQRSSLSSLLAEKIPSFAHHGKCKGADTDFHNLVCELLPYCNIVGHPPIRKGTFVNSKCHMDWPEKEYIERDKDIVDCCDYLIACPDTAEEVLRSGTWTTVRYARKKEKEIYIINPNGEIVTENV